MASQKLSTLGVVLVDTQIPGATSCARKGHKYHNIFRAEDRLANKIHAKGRREIVFFSNVHYTAVAVDIISLQYRVWIGAEEFNSCRSRKMLRNDALMSKISVDANENDTRTVKRENDVGVLSQNTC